jgi:hypothetical protein
VGDDDRSRRAYVAEIAMVAAHDETFVVGGGHQDRAMVEAMVLGGLRRSEVVGEAAAGRLVGTRRSRFEGGYGHAVADDPDGCHVSCSAPV